MQNPKSNGKRVLVTGGVGFIGSHVTDACVAAGYDVAVVDNLSTGRMANLNPAARFYQSDIRSDDLDTVFRQEKPDIVNHHAAQISVPDSVRDPKFDADVNVQGFLNLMECAIRHRVKKVIFISSGGAIYGEADIYPTPETYPPQPLSPYAVTKLIAEHYLQFYRHQFGMDYTVLRYANIYGPRQIPKGEAGVVAIFIENLLAGRPSVINACPNEPRGMERDYCFVGDVARANILAMAPGNAAAVAGVFNIGTGVATKTADLYDIIYNTCHAGQDLQTDRADNTTAIPSRLSPSSQAIHDKAADAMNQTPIHQIKDPDTSPCCTEDPNPNLSNPPRSPARQGDLRRSCLNVEKARTVMGWTPSADLTRGIQKTVAWYSDKHR